MKAGVGIPRGSLGRASYQRCPLGQFQAEVKPGFGFVAGPPGAIGITNLEFCVSSHSADRRNNRRNETLQR